MKHIVVDARESGTTTGRYVDKLIEHLAMLKPEYRFTVLTKPKRVRFIKSIAPDFEVIETKFKEFTFGEQLGLKKQIEALKPDLVHFSMVQQPIFYKGRVVTTMHDLTTTRFKNPSKNWLIFTIKQKIYIWVNKKAARKSLAVITPTEFVKQDVVNFCQVDPAKITVTYEAADAIADKPKSLASLSGDDFIMYVGRPMPHKNLRRLIKAFVILKRSRPFLKLVLAGKKDALFFKHGTYVYQNRIMDVVFTDFVSDGQLLWLYQNCRAYVFPSLSEGFGLPGLEAMQAGAPVVSSNATCLPEVYQDAAHYFDPLDVSDMAEKISEVLDDKNLRDKLILLGRSRVKQYSWDKTARQTLEVYKQALKSQP